MARQFLFSLPFLATVFFLAFNPESRAMGLTSNLYALTAVLAGTLFVTLIAYPWKRLTWTFRLIKKSFSRRNGIDWTISTIIYLARLYRGGDIRGLEREGNELPPGLLKTGVGMIAYQCSRDKIKEALDKEAELTNRHYETAATILSNMANLTQALGLTATIIGLIRTFGEATASQPPAGDIAMALLGLCYGTLVANLGLIPLSNKLKELMNQEGMLLELTKEGLLDLFDQENPKTIEYKLEALSQAVTEPSLTPIPSELALAPLKKGSPSVAS